jgi:hypothetical protein
MHLVRDVRGLSSFSRRRRAAGSEDCLGNLDSSKPLFGKFEVFAEPRDGARLASSLCKRVADPVAQLGARC